MSTFEDSKNRLQQLKKHLALVCLILSFAFLVLTCVGCSNKKLDATPKNFHPHEIEFTSGNINLLWTLDDYRHGNIIRIAAAGGRLFLLVEKETEDTSRTIETLITFDGQTGDLLWQMEHADLRTIYPTETTLFAGVDIQQGSSPYINAYDVENGELLWRSQPIKGTKYVFKIREHEGLLYISTSDPSKYRVQNAQTGEAIHTVDYLRIVLDEREWKIVIPDSEHEKFPDPINPDYFLSPQVPLGIWTRKRDSFRTCFRCRELYFGQGGN